jgi:serine/threonine protein kinase/dienelactone hydrolase
VKGCLSQRDVAAFIEARASAEELAGWKRHLRVCDRCAESVARARAGLEPAPAPAMDAPVPTPVEKADTPVIGLEPNLQIGDFRLEKRLGAGGMGVVYQALQISLNRRVALKVLPMNLAGGAPAIERFHREARAAARLRHPNIVTIYAEGAGSSVCYFAMEMIHGRNLDEIIAELRAARPPKTSPPPAVNPEDEGRTSAESDASAHPATALQTCKSQGEYFNTVARLISEVADALHYAHAEGIIHRDVKPSNLMLADARRLVLLDFGIARICREHGVTLTQSFVGTPRYVSPEQIAGEPHTTDHRCDIYSLGVTLYELLTLEPLFDGDTQQQVIGQILSREPRRPRHINRHIPTDLETICCKAIEKDPNRRYQSAGELAEDLRRYLGQQVIRARRAGAADRLVKLIRRRTLPVALTTGIILAVVFAAAVTWRHFITQWAQQQAMAEIDQLMEAGEYFDALALAERAERIIPNNPLLVTRWPRLSRECTVITSPLDADIYISKYPDGSPRWKYLGRSPIEHARIPFGACHWRIEKTGFTPVEEVRSNDPPSPSVDPASLATEYVGFTLHKRGVFPLEMVWVPPSELTQHNVFHGAGCIPSAPAFLIDRAEVTNRQYRDFVDCGGYQKPEFWQEEFLKDGRTRTWAEAMELFHDQTGRPGPATWRDGTYPRRQRNFPVGGLSWYEAAAYARFRGKDLPTIYHWLTAAMGDDFPYRIAHYSNFDGVPGPVEYYPGMGRFGLYDAAGNVREWCHNAIQGKKEVRAILGGACSDNEYIFLAGETRSPWDRDPGNGLRCAMYPGGRQTVPDLAFDPVECRHRDFTKFTPVSDEVLKSYIDTWYKYDRTELNARVEAVDQDRDLNRRQRITFDAAYPNERVIAYLHLPTGFKPPYQVVVWYPGDEARDDPWDEKAHKPEITAILHSGRAVLVPFYKGTYERRLDKPDYPPAGIVDRNLCVQRSQDMRRAIDYLETREDIDTSRLAYVGLAWGGQMGSLMIAVEERFKTGIFLLGGICACERHPTSDPANFAPRVRIPILMINAKGDSVFPYETAQKPLFDLLGTPEPYKKHVLFPGGHSIPWEYDKEYHAQIVKWLDQYLGPTRRIGGQ